MKSPKGVSVRVKGKEVVLDDSQANLLLKYFEITGVSPERSIYKALEDFIECTIPSHIEVLEKRSAST